MRCLIRIIFDRINALVDGLEGLVAIHSILDASEMSAFLEMISSNVRLIAKTLQGTARSMSEEQKNKILRRTTESWSEILKANLHLSIEMDRLSKFFVYRPNYCST